MIRRSTSSRIVGLDVSSFFSFAQASSMRSMACMKKIRRGEIFCERLALQRNEAFFPSYEPTNGAQPSMSEGTPCRVHSMDRRSPVPLSMTSIEVASAAIHIQGNAVLSKCLLSSTIPPSPSPSTTTPTRTNVHPRRRSKRNQVADQRNAAVKVRGNREHRRPLRGVVSFEVSS